MELRTYLYRRGVTINTEIVLREGKRFFLTMKARTDATQPVELTMENACIGKLVEWMEESASYVEVLDCLDYLGRQVEIISNVAARRKAASCSTDLQEDLLFLHNEAIKKGRKAKKERFLDSVL